MTDIKDTPSEQPEEKSFSFRHLGARRLRPFSERFLTNDPTFSFSIHEVKQNNESLKASEALDRNAEEASVVLLPNRRYCVLTETENSVFIHKHAEGVDTWSPLSVSELDMIRGLAQGFLKDNRSIVSMVALDIFGQYVIHDKNAELLKWSEWHDEGIEYTREKLRVSENSALYIEHQETGVCLSAPLLPTLELDPVLEMWVRWVRDVMTAVQVKPSTRPRVDTSMEGLLDFFQLDALFQKNDPVLAELRLRGVEITMYEVIDHQYIAVRKGKGSATEMFLLNKLDNGTLGDDMPLKVSLADFEESLTPWLIDQKTGKRVLDDLSDLRPVPSRRIPVDEPEWEHKMTFHLMSVVSAELSKMDEKEYSSQAAREARKFLRALVNEAAL